MNRAMRSICLSLAIAFMAALALTGCRDPGPAEEAGRDIDEAVEDARDALDELGEDADDALEEIEDQVD